MTSKEERLVVSLCGGGPWGFRLQGGAGTGLPLIVSKVRRKSKAYRRLREGDRILKVNGRSCEGLTYDQLMDIADKSEADLTLEILRRECDKENQAPKQESTVKAVDHKPSTKELVSFSETSTKTSEEKEGLRIKSVTVVPESKAFETFTSSKLQDCSSQKAPAPAQAVEPFPSFGDLQSKSKADSSTSSKQEFVTGDDKNFTKTKVETKHEIKGGTETSFVKREQESFAKSTSDSHGMPDITLDTIDLNNLISETQKRLDSFGNNFKNDGIFDGSVSEIRKSEITSSSKTSGTKSFETSKTASSDASWQNESSLKQATVGGDMSVQNESSPKKVMNGGMSLQSDFSLQKTVSSDTSVQNQSCLKKTVSSDTTVQNDLNLKKTVTNDTSAQNESSLKKDTEKEVPKPTEPVKKIPPPTLPKPKKQPPCFDAFKDCLREMEMVRDSIFSLPDIGFNSQSSETSTVTTDIPFGTSTTTITKKKKMFSSSSFYEEPQCIYPTVEEQVEMARKIADSLADDTNKKSKGANMFFKRLKRSTKWIHEGPEPSDESGPGTPEIQGVEPPTPDPSQVPFRPSKGPPKLKLVLDPRHTVDINALRSSGYVISEHNVVSPDVCHGLVKDLHSPVGKGAALFAKRKKKSEEWVVDEEKVKALLREQESKFAAPPLTTSPAMNQYPTIGRQEVKLVKSPWEAAMENPYGFCDSAFARVNPDQLANTVLQRADSKRAESLSRESSRMEGCISPPVVPPLTPAGAMYDIYHAKAPKGWLGNPAASNYSSLNTVTPSPLVTNAPSQQTTNFQNGYQPSKKMVFQNFNTVPRLWKGTSVH